MRVLISTDNIGDNYVFTIDLAKSLQEHGVEVFLVVTGVPLSERQKMELDYFDYAFAEFRQEWMENPWDDVEEAGKWLLGIKKMVKPDIVHLNSLSFAALPWNVPVVTVIHSCLLSRWKAVNNEPPPARFEEYKQHVREGLRASNVVVSPSFSMLSQAEKLYGPFKNSRVIPIGRNSYEFRTDVKEKYIFSTGNIRDEAKNIGLILEVAPKIPYPIYIAGDNDKTQINNLPENVIFTGTLTQEQRIDRLANAFIYLCTAKYEPYGYSCLDAAFSKCTLVGSDISSLHEIWQDAVIYFKNKDDLILKINGLMENTEQMFLYGQKAYETALENHRLEKMTRRYHDLYTQIWMLSSANKD